MLKEYYKKLLLIVFIILGINNILFSGTKANFHLLDQYKNQIKKYVLKNGLTVLLFQRKNSHAVTLQTRYRVGSSYEKLNQIGVAHMLEHMMFKGTKQIGTSNYEKEKKYLKAIFRIGKKLDFYKMRLRKQRVFYRDEREKIEKKIIILKKKLVKLQKKHKSFMISNHLSKLLSFHGGVGLNAQTGKDYTRYTVTIPANKLELWANIESDRMQNLVLREFYKERDVIIQERLRNYVVNPSGRLRELLLKAAFSIHPYGRSNIGSMEEIKTLKPVDVREFYENYYTPNNAIIGAVGNFDSDRFIRIIEKYFGPIPPGQSIKPIKIKELKQTNGKWVKISKKVEPLMFVGFRVPEAKHHHTNTLQLLKYLLSRAPKSYLYKALVKNQYASSINISTWPGDKYPHLFNITIKPCKTQYMNKIKNTIFHEIYNLKHSTINEKLLLWAKNKIYADYIRLFSIDENIVNKLLYFEDVYEDYQVFFNFPIKISQVTAKDIRQILFKYFNRKNSIVGMLGQND